MADNGNVTKMQPRREVVHHKGLHGFVEWHPVRKMWSYTLKLVYRIKHVGEHERKEEAILEAKKMMDIAAQGTGRNVRSED